MWCTLFRLAVGYLLIHYPIFRSLFFLLLLYLMEGLTSYIAMIEYYVHPGARFA